MALRDAILVCLADAPMSGYDLAKYFDETIGFFWRATHSQIYRELAKLKDKELVTATEHHQSGKPNRITYAITQKGRQALENWSRQPTAADPVKDDFLVRLYGLEHMDIDALREHLVMRMENHRERYDKFKAIADQSAPGTVAELGRLRGLELGMRYEREWAQWCEETLAALEPGNLEKLEKIVPLKTTKMAN